MNRKSQYRDKEKAKETAKKQKRRYRSRTGSGHKRRAWSIEESQLVLNHTVPDRELALRIGRSVQAIHVHRCRLKTRGVAAAGLVYDSSAPT